MWFLRKPSKFAREHQTRLPHKHNISCYRVRDREICKAKQNGKCSTNVLEKNVVWQLQSKLRPKDYFSRKTEKIIANVAVLARVK